MDENSAQILPILAQKTLYHKDEYEEVKEAQFAKPPPDNDDLIGSNQCLCLPKAELNTKNSTKRQLCCRLVEFLVFNSITHVG